MDIGFENAGFGVVWTNEYDPHFAALYSAGITSLKQASGINAQHSISNQNSLKDIDTATIRREAFDNHVPDHFGMIGGPPCQDFSINGNLEGFKGDRGSLTDTYLCKVLDLEPSFFIMENVTGLLKVKKNAKHFLELLEIMKDEYLIDYAVLNSLDFGVPQNRERVFVVGINKSKYRLDHIQYRLGERWFPFPTGTGHSRTLASAGWPIAQPFGTAVVRPDGIPVNLCVDNCVVNSVDENNIPNAKEYFNLARKSEELALIQEGETNRPSFKRLHRFKYSPTACYGNNEVHLHPYLHRRLSVREALRIQSVPEEYILPPELPLSKKFKMIGNGVPVLLAQALATALADFLRDLQ